MPNHVKVILVGCGNMGKEYMKVLSAQNVETVVIGRSEEGAKAFEEATGVKAIAGGVEKAFSNLLESAENENYESATNISSTARNTVSENKTNEDRADKNIIPENAIVAVNAIALKETTISLIQKGIKRILVEKPAGLTLAEIEEINKAANEHHAEVYVAYNRRYYASVEKAKEIIKGDGGVDSFNFEFTEWGHVISKLPRPKAEIEQVLITNSSHVIDMAFYLGGKPKEISCFTGGKGTLDWHTKCSKYAGAGVTENGVLFSYQANYGAPGRWGVEILTRKHRLYFRPLEKLQVCNLGSVKINAVEIDDSLDTAFKPGLYNEVKDFLSGEHIQIPTIAEQEENCRLYEMMEGEAAE